MFERARDKVNRMGGVGAIREKERERSRGGMGFGWDDGAAKVEREDGEEGEGEAREGEEEGESGYDRRRDAEDEIDAREEGVGKRADEAWGDDDEAGYTMDMMLRSLNVELEVIGFDSGLQKWVD